MSRTPMPTLSDDRQTSTSQLQHLWAELGPGALYYVRGNIGDCMEIEIRVTRDLMNGSPYDAELKLEVAFVRENAEAAGAAVDALLLGFVEDDDACDSGDRITVEFPVGQTVDQNAPTPVPPPPEEERVEVDFVHYQVIQQKPGCRLLHIRPVVELPHTDARRWLLEIRVTEYDLARRVSWSGDPLIPRTT